MHNIQHNIKKHEQFKEKGQEKIGTSSYIFDIAMQICCLLHACPSLQSVLWIRGNFYICESVREICNIRLHINLYIYGYIHFICK
jgi:hypothetical protein